MSDSSSYIRPIARFTPTAVAPRGAGGPLALAIAGRGDLLFAASELIERESGEVRKRIISAAELLAGGLASAEQLLRLQQPREAIAGLALDRPRIMGVVNVTPDSFSDGGSYPTTDAAVAHALRLEAEGADVLDIGGESTRPRSDPVDLEEECRRVLKPGGQAIFQVYNRVSWLNVLSKVMKVGLEHDDAPVLLKFSIREFRELLAGLSDVRIVPERFPVNSRLHGGWKGALYNGVFVGTFNLLPRAMVGRFGWHLLAFCRK